MANIGASIGLCMIVKDEAHVIRRCFDSVLPIVDYILVVDTGSTDGTQEVIQTYLQEKNIAGEVIEEPWRNFAYNRTFALKALRSKQLVDYSLMIDADNVIAFDPEFDAQTFKRSLTLDVYEMQFQTHDAFYWLPRLISHRLDVCYKGVLHEYLEYSQDCSREFIQGILNRQIQDSNRNRNPRKYFDDAAVLETALKIETDPFLISRYMFYLAQSYRDCQSQPAKALITYQEHAKQEGWIEERYISLYESAKLKIQLGFSSGEIIQTYMDAYELLPSRAEALHGAMRYCREHRKYHQGYLIGNLAIAISFPVNGLFLEKWIYDYGILDEFAIVAEWSGHNKEAFDACLQILAEQKIPTHELPRILKNIQLILDKLGVSVPLFQ